MDNQNDIPFSSGQLFAKYVSNSRKIFYRLADKRSLEWWKFQKELLDEIKNFKPNTVLTTGVLPLDPAIFKEIILCGGQILNYLTDDPWNEIHKRRSFQGTRKAIIIFFDKKELQKKLKEAGAQVQVGFLCLRPRVTLSNHLPFINRCSLLEQELGNDSLGLKR